MIPQMNVTGCSGDNGVLVAENMKILLSKCSPRKIVKRKLIVYDCLMISRNLCKLVVHTLIPCRFFLQPCAMHFLILVVDSQNVFTPTGIICSKATTVPGTWMGQYQSLYPFIVIGRPSPTCFHLIPKAACLL